MNKKVTKFVNGTNLLLHVRSRGSCFVVSVTIPPCVDIWGYGSDLRRG